MCVCVCDGVCSGFLPDHSGATMTGRGVRLKQRLRVVPLRTSLSVVFGNRKRGLTTFPRGHALDFVSHEPPAASDFVRS